MHPLMLPLSLQALWALASVCKSTVPVRQQAAAAIVSSARKHHADAAAAGAGDASGRQSRLFQQFASLSDQLIRLCHHNTSDHREKGCASPFTSVLLHSLFLSVFGQIDMICSAMPPYTSEHREKGAVIWSGDSAARLTPWLHTPWLHNFPRTAQEELLDAPRVQRADAHDAA